jgi:hypothetical protein
MAITHPQQFGHWTVQFAGDSLVVTPDPFGNAMIPIEVNARALRDQPFRSDDDLRAALSAAKNVTVSGTVSGAA